ncbi:MAG: SulP family inorganic anion transporter [Actinomycetes bacterium]
MSATSASTKPGPLQRWVPGVGMLRTYRRSWLRNDFIAGVVLAAILVPQGMAYAELAGVPAVNGLYTTIACLVGYAVFGPSRILVLGPDSSVAPLIFAAITPLLVTDDPAEAVALAAMMALMVGAIEVGLGLGKLGFVADLLSKEVQVGYMNGLAITIIVGQLPKLFGFSTDADGFVNEVKAFFDGLDQTNTTALAIGLATLAVLLILPRVTSKVPAVLVAVVGATVVTGLLDLSAKGVDVVGALPQGLPKPAFPSVPLDSLGPLLAASFGIVLVSLTDTIATSTSFAARRGDEVEPNQEMIGMGAANVAAGMFQGFAISASGSRTAVAEQSGSKSQVTGLAGAGIVAILLLFLPSLLQNLPQPALAAVVIAAALSLFNFGILSTYYRMRRSALVISLVTSLGVILFGVLQGILIAVILSILLFFRRNWWPEGEVLGRVRELDGWHSTKQYPRAEEADGVVVYRWEAPLFFANAGIFRQEIRRLVRQRKPTWVVLECAAITDIDVTAADMLERLDQELNDQGVYVVFVEMRSRIEELLEQYGLFATFTREHVYPTIDMAVSGIQEESAPGDDPTHAPEDLDGAS